MAFIDVFKAETNYRDIYGQPTKNAKSAKVFILEYLLVKVPDRTKEKRKLEYLYGKYNIGDKVTEYNTDSSLGAPVPNASPFTYLKLDGSNSMDSDYVPINPKSIITLDYFQSYGTGLQLGETSTTAYRGDRGKIAYNHSLTSHAPSDAEANRPISDSLTLASSTTSASSAAVKALEDGKSATSHNHDLVYEPINSNIQTHISDTSIHITTLLGLNDIAPSDYIGQQGRLLKVNATEDGMIFGDPSGTTVGWGDISGTLSTQTDLQAALDLKVGDTQVLTNVPAGALFTDTVYDDTTVTTHIGTTTGNPHSVSVTDLGLQNVDNTSDAAKPVSTLQQAALDLKQDKLMTDFVVSTTYSTIDADSAKTAIVQDGGTVTLDSATVSTGFMLQIYNDKVTDTTILVETGDTIKNDNPALIPGYFAYALYLGANDWVVSIGGAATGGVTDHTALTNIGTNTHAQIDTHISNNTGTNSGDQDLTGLAPKNPTLRTISGTTDTLVLIDDSKYIRCTSTSATAVTIPPNSSVAFAVGAQINIRQANTGAVTITEGAGVTINTEETLVLAGQHATVTIIKVATDQWDIMGSLTPA